LRGGFKLGIIGPFFAIGGLYGPDDGLADNGSVVQGYVSAAAIAK